MLSAVSGAARSMVEVERRQHILRCARSGAWLSDIRFSRAERQGAAVRRHYCQQVEGGGSEPRPLLALGRLPECTAHFHKPGADHTH